MRILLIGATGFLGPHVRKSLAAAGHDVTVYHRGSGCSEPNHIHGERDNLPVYASEFRRLAPDAVIDFILSSGRQARALMDVFRGVAGRVVAISSVDVYRACGILHGTEPGPPDPTPLTEDSPLRTRPAYSTEVLRGVQTLFPWVDDEYDKVPVERAVMEDDRLPGTVLRLPMIYGPGDRLHRLHPILKRVDDGRPAILLEEGVAQWRGPRGYVEDVAAAVALAATDQRAAGRIYNVAQAENFSELEWTACVAGAAGFAGRVLVVPRELAPTHLCPPYHTAQHWAADSARIREELDFRETVPFADGLRRTVDWERANPPAQTDPKQFDYDAEDAALEKLTAYRPST